MITFAFHHARRPVISVTHLWIDGQTVFPRVCRLQRRGRLVFRPTSHKHLPFQRPPSIHCVSPRFHMTIRRNFGGSYSQRKDAPDAASGKQLCSQAVVTTSHRPRPMSWLPARAAVSSSYTHASESYNVPTVICFSAEALLVVRPSVVIQFSRSLSASIIRVLSPPRLSALPDGVFRRHGDFVPQPSRRLLLHI